MSDEKRFDQPTEKSKEADSQVTSPESNMEQFANSESPVLNSPALDVSLPVSPDSTAQASDAPLPVSQERAPPLNQVSQVSDVPQLLVSQEQAPSDPVAQVTDASLLVAQVTDALLLVAQEQAPPDQVFQVTDASLLVAQEQAPPDPVVQVSDASLLVAQEQAPSDPVSQASDAPETISQDPDATAKRVDPSEDVGRESPILSDISEHTEPNETSSEATKSSTTSSESRSKLLEESVSEQGLGSTEPSSTGSRLPSGTQSSDHSSSLPRSNTQQSSSTSTSDSALGLGTYEPSAPRHFPPPSFEVAVEYRTVGGYRAGPIPGSNFRPGLTSPQSSFESYSDPGLPSIDTSAAKSPGSTTGASMTSLNIESEAQVGDLSLIESAKPASVDDSSSSSREPSVRLFLREPTEEDRNCWRALYGYPRTLWESIFAWICTLLPVIIFIITYIILFVSVEKGHATIGGIFAGLCFLLLAYAFIYFCFKFTARWTDE